MENSARMQTKNVLKKKLRNGKRVAAAPVSDSEEEMLKGRSL